MSDLAEPYIFKNDKGRAEQIHIPHSLEELWGYFEQREEQDPEKYTGYASVAAVVADNIEMVRRNAGTPDQISLNLPIMPNRDSAVWVSEQTPASRELVELVFAVNKLEPVADETTEQDPYGRVLWQSTEFGTPYSFIEHRWSDNKGDVIMLSVVANDEVPTDLLEAQVPDREYTGADKIAIRKAKALQKASSAAVNRMLTTGISQDVEEELDYLLFVNGLETAPFESPYDQREAA